MPNFPQETSRQPRVSDAVALSFQASAGHWIVRLLLAVLSVRCGDGTDVRLHFLKRSC